MKLIRFGTPGEERPGVWLESAEPEAKPMLLDIRAMAFDIEDYNEHFFAHFGLERVANLLREPGRQPLRERSEWRGKTMPDLCSCRVTFPPALP